MKLYILLFILPVFGNAQSDWQKVEPRDFLDLIITCEKSIAQNEHYSFATSYKIYANHGDLLPAQTFDGKLSCRAGKEFNIHQMGITIIQDATFNLTIDTAARQIAVQKADPSFLYRKTQEDYGKFIAEAASVSKKVGKNSTIYMVKLNKGNPYDAMEFSITPQNAISQVIIYGNQPFTNYDDGEPAAMAKIIMDFRDLQKGKNVDFSKFQSVKNCIKITDGRIIGIGNYKEFEVIDLRN